LLATPPEVLLRPARSLNAKSPSRSRGARSGLPEKLFVDVDTFLIALGAVVEPRILRIYGKRPFDGKTIALGSFGFTADFSAIWKVLKS